MKDYRDNARCLFCAFFIGGLFSMIFYTVRLNINSNYKPMDCIIWEYKEADGGPCAPVQGCDRLVDDDLYAYVNKKNRTFQVISKGWDQPYIDKDWKKDYEDVPRNDTCYYQTSTDVYYGMFIKQDTESPMIAMIVFSGVCTCLMLYMFAVYVSLNGYQSIPN